LTRRAREKRAHSLLKKAGKLVDKLTTLLDEARLELERNEKGEYVKGDGRLNQLEKRLTKRIKARSKGIEKALIILGKRKR